jgi:hypothetical protein
MRESRGRQVGFPVGKEKNKERIEELNQMKDLK